MYDFELCRPHSVNAASDILAANPEAKIIAGGYSLLPVLKQRLAKPSHLIDMSLIPGLAQIEVRGEYLTIGAMVRHATVAFSEEVQKRIPALSDLASQIGDPAVRNAGTMGGSLANNDPAADYAAACMALNATIVTNKRELVAEKFFQGLFTTALERDEIITSIRIPKIGAAAYVKIRNRASRFALAGVFVCRQGGSVRMAVTGSGASGVFRLFEFEEALQRDFDPGALAGLSVSAAEMMSDWQASAEFRAHIVAVAAGRAVGKALNGPETAR